MSSAESAVGGKDADGPLQAGSVACSPGLTAWLARHRISIALTSYQAGQVFLLGRFFDGTLSLYRRDCGRAMGVWAQDRTLVFGSAVKIWRLENVLNPGERANQRFDALFVPRTVHVTGDMDIHEVAMEADGRIVFVATRYACLATLSPTHSFQPIWKPPFISRLAAEDRCHLNGMALENGSVRYVTVCATTDTAEGWRAHRGTGGALIRTTDGAVIADGFSMPHSPRVHEGAVYVLESGRGYLVRVDPATGQRADVAFCPGFLRGLVIHEGYALATLSLPRSISFEGLPLEQELKRHGESPHCGLAIIHLASGRIEEWVRFDTHIRELFDVAVVRGATCPMAASLRDAELADLITLPQGEL